MCGWGMHSWGVVGDMHGWRAYVAGGGPVCLKRGMHGWSHAFPPPLSMVGKRSDQILASLM